MTPRTPEGVLLSNLMDRLAVHVGDDEISVCDWANDCITAFADLPEQLWPMDDWFFEMLLEIAGFDLTWSRDLEVAAEIGAYLRGTGLVSFICSHGDQPSELCAKTTADRRSFTNGRDFAASRGNLIALNADRQINWDGAVFELSIEELDPRFLDLFKRNSGEAA